MGREMRREEITDGHEELLGDDGYVDHLYCGDAFMELYISAYQTLHFKCVWIIGCQFYHSKAVKLLIMFTNSKNNLTPIQYY